MQKFFWYSIETINLSLNELKLFAKSRGIKDYKNKSEDELIKKIQQTKTKKKNFLNKKYKRLEKNLMNLRDRFSKPKIKEIRRNLYEIENE